MFFNSILCHFDLIIFIYTPLCHFWKGLENKMTEKPVKAGLV
jgi:hypothetical protein